MKEKKNLFDLKLAIVAIILFAAVVRIYFFNLVKTQAHWWDSLAYGSLAKNMIYHMWDSLPFIAHEAIIRPPIFPLIWSFLIRIGASDYAVIFLTGIIPSIISVYLVYLIGREMYSKKVGLAAAVFASVSWIHLFYSARAMTDIPSMCLILASIYFFIKSHDSFSLKPWSISVFLLSLAVLFRYSHAVIAIAYVAFLVFVHKGALFKSKNFWLGGLIGAFPLIFFILINLVSYGSILPATSEYSSSIGQKTSFAWYTFGFINYILMSPLIFLFYIGLAIMVLNVFMSYGFIFKNKASRMHAFSLILLVVVLSFFIFIIKAAEDRYLLGLSSILFIIPAISLSYVYRLAYKHRKEAAVIVCIVLVAWSMYSQLSFAKTLMLDKKESYRQMKDAFEWIKHNTDPSATITGEWADPYAIYYAERKVQALPQDLNFSGFSLEADYVVINAIHPPTEQVLLYFSSLAESGRIRPIKAFFLDSAQTQPGVIIYQKAV